MRYKIIIVIVFYLITLNLFSARISGFVVDNSNGEKVPFATILNKGTNQGSYSNQQGFFTINKISKGKNILIVTQVGYKHKEIEVNITDINETKFVTIEIEPQTIKMDEYVVKGERVFQEIKTPEIRVSGIRQTNAELQELPQIAEADIFRAIQTLPGVVPISDFSSGLYIRGGSPDQNLILLDGVDVYNPNHFGGFFSAFNTDAVSSVNLMKGGFPARYGGRLSSVLDISNLDGNRKNNEGVFRVSLISMSATVQQPHPKGSIMGSFRRTYFDLLRPLYSQIPDYYFYDGHTKFNYDITPQTKYSGSVYFGKDKLKVDIGDKMVIEWGNETFSNKLTHVFSSEILSELILAGSHFGSYFIYDSESNALFKRLNDVYDVTLKQNFNYKPDDKNLFDFGYEFKYNRITFKTSVSESYLSEDSFPDVDLDCLTSAIYWQNSWNFKENWTLQPGIRLNYYFGKARNLDASPKGSYFNIAPRISIRRYLSESSSAFFAYGRYYQYLTSVSFGMSSPLDLWFPVDGTVDPGESDHFIIGYKKQFLQQFEIESEIYYKSLRNLVELRPEIDYEWSNETGTLADIYNVGKGYAYGFEFLLRNELGALEGFSSYSFSISRRKTNSMNINPETGKEEWYYPRYDRTHQLNIMETINLSYLNGTTFFGSEFKIGIAYNYLTGQPYYQAEGIYLSNEGLETINSYSDRIRLDSYQRVDLSIKFLWEKRFYNIEPYIQVINLFNNPNVWTVTPVPMISEGDDELDEGDLYIKNLKTYQFPRLIFIGVNLKW